MRMLSVWLRRSGRALSRGGPPHAGLILLVALLLSAALPSGCAAKRTVVFDDEKTHRSVTIIDGVEPVQPPADPRFANFSPLQAEASLRRVVVRPSYMISVNHRDPQPLLEGPQLEWVRDTIVQEFPRVLGTQRLELHFLDRFNQFDVTVEVYGSGPDLVYRFTRLATPPDPPDAGGSAAARRADFAELWPQAGQQVESARTTVVLRDPVFSAQGGGEALARVLAEVQGRVDAKRLSPEDVAPIDARLRQQRDLSLETVRLYLDKLETINRALEQNLFTEQEATARKRALLDALPAVTTPAAKP